MIPCKILFKDIPATHCIPLLCGLFSTKIGVVTIYENVNLNKLLLQFTLRQVLVDLQTHKHIEGFLVPLRLDIILVGHFQAHKLKRGSFSFSLVTSHFLNGRISLKEKSIIISELFCEEFRIYTAVTKENQKMGLENH